MASGAVLAIVAASILLVLIRPRGVAEVWWAGGGAVLLVATGLAPLRVAGRAIADGTDVYTFLVGMMLLSALAREVGVFDWLATLTVQRSRGSSARLFTWIYGVGALVTIFMSNDAAAVVLTPAILVAVRTAKAKPLPHLFACALIANAASFVLPISNPANLVVFRGDLPSLGRWLAAFALPSALAIGATYAGLRVMFRRDLTAALDTDVRVQPLARGGRWVVGGLGLVVGVLLAASATGMDLGVPTLGAATLVAAVVCGRERLDPRKLIKAISGSTLLLVAALFVMVAAVERIGALAVTTQWLARLGELPDALGAAVTSAAVAVSNNVVNNLPLGLVAGATVRQAHPSSLLTQAILIGVDLGPNLSVTGSLATILWLLALRKERVRVRFLDFLRVGAVVMPAGLLAAIAGLLAVHALGGP